MKIVRNKADKRPIEVQVNEQCDRLDWVVTRVKFDKNYLEIEGEPRKRP